MILRMRLEYKELEEVAFGAAVWVWMAARADAIMICCLNVSQGIVLPTVRTVAVLAGTHFCVHSRWLSARLIHALASIPYTAGERLKSLHTAVQQYQ